MSVFEVSFLEAGKMGKSTDLGNFDQTVMDGKNGKPVCNQWLVTNRSGSRKDNWRT